MSTDHFREQLKQLEAGEYSRIRTNCQVCGAQLAPILARLGSLFCHDHRPPSNAKHGGFSG